MLGNSTKDIVWAQKYRPSTLDELILPKRMKDTFQSFVDAGEVPNIILYGKPGTGKTSAVLAIMKMLGADYMMINGSTKNGIDTLRYDITDYASTVSMDGGRKYVIIDEADALTMKTQEGLRNAIESFSKNCSFIFTCNMQNKIFAPLMSRFAEFEFSFSREEHQQMQVQFFKRVKQILASEEVEYDPKVVAQIVSRFYPDFRKTLVELQLFSSSGKIDESALKSRGDIETLFSLLKEKKFKELREWVAANSDLDTDMLYQDIYEYGYDSIELQSLPAFIVTLHDYQYKSSFVASEEINLMAFLSEIMVECRFK